MNVIRQKFYMHYFTNKFYRKYVNFMFFTERLQVIIANNFHILITNFNEEYLLKKFETLFWIF